MEHFHLYSLLPQNTLYNPSKKLSKFEKKLPKKGDIITQKVLKTIAPSEISLPYCGYTPSDYHKVMSGRHSIMIFMPTRCIKNGQNINLNTLFREVLRIF